VFGFGPLYSRPDFGGCVVYLRRSTSEIRVDAMPQFTVLWTDAFIFFLLVLLMLYAFRVTRSPALKAAWGSVARTPSAMCAAVLLVFFVLVGVLDSIHYRPQLPPAPGQESGQPVYAPVLRSALDDILAPTRMANPEATYSAPLA